MSTKTNMINYQSLYRPYLILILDYKVTSMIDETRLVNTFLDLIKIDSPSDEEEEVAQHVTPILQELGFTVERDSHGNLIASEPGDNPLMLSAHMDTVEPGRGIKPRIEDGRIITDGSTILGGDCKAGMAAILEGLTSLQTDGTERIPVQVVFTRGEEIGLVGASNLDYSMLKADHAVVFDGNGPVNHITGCSPTYMKFDVTVHGRAAHAGVEPEKGLSSIRIASEIIQELPQGRLDDETTFNVGLINGGTVRNAVPPETTFGGEFRSMNTETIELLKMQVTETLDKFRTKYSEANIDESFEVMFRMYNLDPEERIAKISTGTMEEMGLVPNIKPSGGGTDANVMRLHGIESVVVGMATNEMHTVNEFVIISELVEAATFCSNLIKKV